ncbi:hypothetical protein LTR37_013043 [Vermiconidia calcicola]|uniref:Uncharacterized protein n=1 Tax=Vermiconidia calcicola TaxID=1690605 RepID=A0ACC3MYW9_9PEZI|nr:hypothetical protein LTR37_013043 [Vermiconidia calcicola]
MSSAKTLLSDPDSDVPDPRTETGDMRDPESAKGTSGCKKGKTQFNHELRRPVYSGQYYSVATQIFLGRGTAKRRMLSHVGRIEESEHGVESEVACTQCHELESPDLSRSIRCKVYNEEARAKYHAGGGKRCARCIFDNKRCSLDDSTTPPPAKKAKKPRAELEVEIEELKARLAQYEDS